MIILPAIDIKDGNCVRLLKGDYATAQQVAESPYEGAQRFAEAGATWMHMVDPGRRKGRKARQRRLDFRRCKDFRTQG